MAVCDASLDVPVGAHVDPPVSHLQHSTLTLILTDEVCGLSRA